MTRTHLFLLPAAALLLAATIGPAHLPPPYATPSADNHCVIVNKPAGASLHVPAGFHIDEWSSDLEMPRSMLGETISLRCDELHRG